MANTHGILAIIGAALAAVTALILFGGAVILPAAFGIGAGIYIALREKENKLILASGAIATLAGILAALGALGGAGGGGFGASFGFLSGGIASALAILACLEVSASALKLHWDDMPQAVGISVAVALGAAVLLAFILNGQLANQGNWPAYVVAVLSLAGIYPGIVAVRS